MRRLSSRDEEGSVSAIRSLLSMFRGFYLAANLQTLALRT